MNKAQESPDGSTIGLVVRIMEDVDDNIWVETLESPRTLTRIDDCQQDTRTAGLRTVGSSWRGWVENQTRPEERVLVVLYS